MTTHQADWSTTLTATRPIRYRDVLRVPCTARLLIGTLIARLPTAMAPLAIILVTVQDGYAFAGTLTAMHLLANAVGGPLIGRLVDRFGQTRTLTAGAVVAGAGLTLLAAVGTAQTGIAVFCVLIAGAAKPPHDASLRVLFKELMPTRDHERVALALDAATQELIFACGPLLVVAIAQTASPRWSLLGTAAIGLLGTAIVVTTPPSRNWKGAQRHTDWLGPLRSHPLRSLYLSMICAGLPMGALTPVALGMAGRLHEASLSGTLPAAVSVGALLGGLAYGARSWPGTATSHLWVLCGGFGAGWLLLLAAHTPFEALAACLLPGLLMAPLLSAAYRHTSALAPAGSVTEAGAVLVAALDVGCAAGTAAAGLAPTPALLPIGPAAACLLLLVARRGHRSRPAAVATRSPLTAPSGGITR